MIKYFYFTLILIFSWFFFSFKITEVPPAINGDEVPIGVNAILISQTLHDENGRFLPIFFSSQNLTDFKQPINTYTTAAFFKIFGPSYKLMRQVSIFFILLTGVLIFILIKEVFGFKWAFIGILIFLTIPIIMIQSHLALENIAPLPFVTLWLLMLVKFNKNGKLYSVFLAGLSIALSFYSYLGMRLVVPILGLLTFFYILVQKKKNSLNYLIFFILGTLPLSVFIPFIHKQYPGAILAYNRPALPSSYQEFFLPYISSFDPSFLFIKGDSTPYHSTGKQGMFLLASLPLFLMGIYQALKQKNFFLKYSVIIFFSLPLLYGLVPSVHRASRLLVLIPPYVILTTLGVITLSKLRLRGLEVIIILILFLNYYDFIRDYWYDYSGRVRPDFKGVAHIAFEDLYKKSKELNLIPVMQRSIYNNELPSSKFFELVYFQSSLSTWDLGETIPNGVVLLHHQSDSSLVSSQGLRKLDIEMPYYSLSKR